MRSDLGRIKEYLWCYEVMTCITVLVFWFWDIFKFEDNDTRVPTQFFDNDSIQFMTKDKYFLKKKIKPLIFLMIFCVSTLINNQSIVSIEEPIP